MDARSFPSWPSARTSTSSAARTGKERSRNISTSCASDPEVTRNAFERVYDMIMSYGTDTYEVAPREARPLPLLRRSGQRRPRRRLRPRRAAAACWSTPSRAPPQGYGIEKRVLLLHGPVGSSKSTIARLLKKGLERYSQHRRRRALHARLGRSGRSRPGALVPDERGAAAPDSRAVPRRRVDAS